MFKAILVLVFAGGKLYLPHFSMKHEAYISHLLYDFCRSFVFSQWLYNDKDEAEFTIKDGIGSSWL